MLGLVISVATIAISLWLVARHDAEINLHIIALIAVVVGVGGGVLSAFIGIMSLPIILIVLAVALIRFCYTSIPQASIVCVIWLVVQIAWSMLLRA